MSLHHIAQHLKDQGRGPDDMLVHMTRGEVKALQGLAQAHGGSLTVNPHTGLPEAGFLSTALPMALGALAVATGQVEFLPMIAAGVGIADYALTGSLQQGLMAGLGTWSGGTLAGGLGAAGAAEIAAEGGNAATAAYEKSLEQIGANGAQIPAGAIPTEMGTYNPATGAEVTTQSLASDAVSKAGLKAAQESALQQAIQAGGNTSEIVGAAGRLGTTPTITEGLARGISSPSAIGETIMNNKMALAGVAAPLLSGALNNKPTVPGTTAQKNPFGLKTIPRDENGNPIFNASIPEQPNPAYQAVYPDYQTNPYRPVGAAEGGVMKMAVGGSAPMIGTPAQNTTMDSSVGNNAMFPMSEMARSYYATPTQLPAGINAQNNPSPAGQSDPSQIPGYGPRLDTNTGQMTNNFADGGLANLPYVQQSQNQPATSNGYTPAGGGSTYGQGQFSPQTMAMPTMGLDPQAPFSQMGMPTQFAQGGIAQYAGNYGSMVSGMQDVEEGLNTATKRRLMETPTPDFGDMREDSDLAKLDSYNRAQALLKKHLTASHVKPSKGLPKAAVLGAIDMTPAAQAAAETKAKQAIAQDADTTEAKEGGLMGYAMGGHLGAYSDGGRLLKGPGDGVSDSIPATIGGKQPARLAEGEFVIPARIVSELGNGSTDAGAKRLYAMMDRIKAKRSKTKNIAADTKAYRYLPA